MLEALIFDVDGTLAETEELHRRAFNETFAAAGIGWHWDRETYARLLRTTGGKERMAAYAEEIGEGAAALPIADLHAEKTRRYGDAMAEGGIALRPGIAELIALGQAAGMSFAVATTTSAANVDALCRAVFRRPAAQVFDVIAAGDMVARKKPAPDVYLLALRLLGVEARHALALEDSRNGVVSACAAGIACIVSPGIYTAGEDFSGALAVCDSFVEIASRDRLEALLARSPAG